MTDTAPLLENATRDLACFAAGLRFEAIPAAVVEHAKLCVLDGLGVALFGSRLPWTRHVRDLAVAEGGDAGRFVLGESGARVDRPGRPGERDRRSRLRDG